MVELLEPRSGKALAGRTSNYEHKGFPTATCSLCKKKCYHSWDTDVAFSYPHLRKFIDPLDKFIARGPILSRLKPKRGEGDGGVGGSLKFNFTGGGKL